MNRHEGMAAMWQITILIGTGKSPGTTHVRARRVRSH
jgi:hypothetical protein